MTNPSEEEFGTDRFQLFLEKHHDLSATKLVDSLLDELACWSDRLSGREPEDDSRYWLFTSIVQRATLLVSRRH